MIGEFFLPNDFVAIQSSPINRIFISPRRFYLHRNSAAAHCLPRTATIFPRGGKGRGNFEKPSSSRHNISSNGSANFRIKRKKNLDWKSHFTPSSSLFIKAIRRSSAARGRHARHKKAARLSARGHAPFNPRPCVGEEPWGCTAVEINRGWPELSSNLISARHRWPTTESRAASVRWREG